MHSIINAYLGQKLKTLRESSCRKQADMAMAFQITQQSYSKIERGQTNFSNKILNNIAQVFDISPLDFLSVSLDKKGQITRTGVEDFATRIIIAGLKKHIAEQKLRIAELEIASITGKISTPVSKNIKPLYVMI